MKLSDPLLIMKYFSLCLLKLKIVLKIDSAERVFL